MVSPSSDEHLMDSTSERNHFQTLKLYSRLSAENKNTRTLRSTFVPTQLVFPTTYLIQEHSNKDITHSNKDSLTFGKGRRSLGWCNISIAHIIEVIIQILTSIVLWTRAHRVLFGVCPLCSVGRSGLSVICECECVCFCVGLWGEWNDEGSARLNSPHRFAMYRIYWANYSNLTGFRCETQTSRQLLLLIVLKGPFCYFLLLLLTHIPSSDVV